MHQLSSVDGGINQAERKSVQSSLRFPGLEFVMPWALLLNWFLLLFLRHAMA